MVDEVHKLFAKDDCQRPKEREQADFEQGLDGGWFDHGFDSLLIRASLAVAIVTLVGIPFELGKMGKSVAQVFYAIGIVCPILCKARADS